jgi:type IV conjugative transfer system protein TraE
VLEKYFLQASSNVVLVNRILLIVIAMLVAVSFLNYQQAKNYIDQARIILVTPNMAVDESTMIITSSGASDDYLRKVTRYALGLFLNYTPADIASQYEELLRLYSPATYEEERLALMDLRDRVMESSRITSSFIIEEINHDQASKTLAVKGFRTRVSREGTMMKLQEAVIQNYTLEYDIKNGRLYVLRIRNKQ